MKAPPFDYIRAESVAQACALLQQHGSAARLIAGGQSLLPAMNLRLASPDLLIDTARIEGLAGIELRGNLLRIGALARQQTVLMNDLVRLHVPLLAEALRHVAHPAIRARGTIGGNLAHADPASELPACMLALDAAMEAVSPRGARRIAVEDFFTGLFQTALAADEMLTAVEIPLPAQRFYFEEISRRHGDYAVVGLAAAGTRQSPRFAFFSAADRPVLAQRAADLVVAGDVQAARAALARDLDPPGDLQATPETRLHLAGVLLGRAVAALEMLP